MDHLSDSTESTDSAVEHIGCTADGPCATPRSPIGGCCTQRTGWFSARKPGRTDLTWEDETGHLDFKRSSPREFWEVGIAVGTPGRSYAGTCYRVFSVPYLSW